MAFFKSSIVAKGSKKNAKPKIQANVKVQISEEDRKFHTKKASQHIHNKNSCEEDKEI